MIFEDRWSLNTGGHKDRFHCTESDCWDFAKIVLCIDTLL